MKKTGNIIIKSFGLEELLTKTKDLIEEKILIQFYYQLRKSTLKKKWKN